MVSGDRTAGVGRAVPNAEHVAVPPWPRPPGTTASRRRTCCRPAVPCRPCPSPSWCVSCRRGRRRWSARSSACRRAWKRSGWCSCRRARWRGYRRMETNPWPGGPCRRTLAAKVQWNLVPSVPTRSTVPFKVSAVPPNTVVPLVNGAFDFAAFSFQVPSSGQVPAPRRERRRAR